MAIVFCARTVYFQHCLKSPVPVTDWGSLVAPGTLLGHFFAARCRMTTSKITEPKTVYFAGKVAHHGGYRGRLFGSERVMSNGYYIYEINGGRICYGGPFALSCDHGCYHKQGSHGLLDWAGVCGGSADDLPECEHYNHSFGCANITRGLKPHQATNRCMEQIRECDAVHAYLDTVSCYGTLAELGYASALGKPIYIYYKANAQNWQKHFWFIFNLPGVKSCKPGEETSIHPDLLTPAKSYRERYHEYLASDEWKALREQKLFEAGGRCQLCNDAGRLNIHHRTYDRIFNELIGDLIVLCERCHKKFHDLHEEVS